MDGCWFGWCDSGSPIIVDAMADDLAPGNDGGADSSGNSGMCTKYQPQTFKLFGISFGNRNEETRGSCRDFC